jgi:glycerol-3-phosphate O-acyltransferase
VLAELGETTTPLTPARRRALVTRLAYRAMNEINRVTAITPSALVATALLTHGKRGLPHAELVEACERLARILRGEGARFSPSLVLGGHGVDKNELRHGAIREACELLVKAGHVETHRPGVPIGDKSAQVKPGPDAIYVVPDAHRLSLDLMKNLVVHFFVSRAMIATPLVAAAKAGETVVPSALLAERVQALSRLLKYELQFRADATFETIFAETLGAMSADGEVVVDDEGNVALAANGEGRERANLHARMVKNFVEGYRVAARGLTSLLKGPLAQKDLAKRAMTAGERMFLAGELELREAVCRPVVENALLAFVDQGYVGREEGKFVLPESYDTAETVRTIESRIASFL